jgi:hypothetical protein
MGYLYPAPTALNQVVKRTEQLAVLPVVLRVEHIEGRE